MMRVLIVDDEAKALDGMVYTFKKHLPEFEVTAALTNPLEVIPFLEKKPVDLLFTDVKMPEMSGTELTARVRALFPETYIVVLSAYSDFEYVRTCMKNGAWDYLLKPASYQSIVSAAKRIEGLVNSNRQSQLRLERQHMLRDSLTKNLPLPEKAFEGGRQLTLFLCLPGAEQDYGEALSDILSGLIDLGTPPFRSGDYLVMMAIRPMDERQVREAMDVCTRMIRKNGYEACLGAVTLTRDRSPADAFRTGRHMLEHYSFNRIFSPALEKDYRELLEQAETTPCPKTITGDSISKLVSLGKASELQSLLRRVTSELLERMPYLIPRETKKRLLDELMAVMREMKGLDPSQLNDSHTYLSELQQVRGLPEFMDMLCGFLLKIADLSGRPVLPGYIRATVEYIHANYMTELSLKQAADHIHLNPWHLSTQFKKYMDVGFSEYLNLVRIQNSKKLLEQGGLKIYEIADIVGFKETAYFCTVFKRVEGVSPGDYQKSANRREFG